MNIPSSTLPIQTDTDQYLNEQNIIDYLNYTSIIRNVSGEDNINNYNYNQIYPSFGTFQHFNDDDSVNQEAVDWIDMVTAACIDTPVVFKGNKQSK